jgi:hypothetical protein
MSLLAELISSCLQATVEIFDTSPSEAESAIALLGGSCDNASLSDNSEIPFSFSLRSNLSVRRLT